MESRNIEMPNNREIVRAHFLKAISDEVIKEEGNFNGPAQKIEVSNEVLKKEEKTKSTDESAQLKFDKTITKIRSSLILQTISNIKTDEDEEPSKETSFHSSLGSGREFKKM